jgi:ribonuclease Z
MHRDTIAVVPTEAAVILCLDRDPEPVFKDENITLYAIPVLPADNARPVPTPSDTEHPESLQGEPAQVQTIFPGSQPPKTDHPREPTGFSCQLPKSTPPGDLALAYVLVGPRAHGKFDVKKAAALGVPSGQIRSRLTRGETVSFMSEGVERVVRPEDCVGESGSPGVSAMSADLDMHSGCLSRWSWF